MNQINYEESKRMAYGLYDPRFEHDNCGIGAVVDIKGMKSHETVYNALKIVENLEHRAGKDAEGKTGDGVGILLQISHKFFTKAVEPWGIKLEGERDYGIGMFFFPNDELKRNQAKKMFEIIVKKEGLEFLGWRCVPTQKEVLGQKALSCMPYIMQGFVKRPANINKGLDFDRKLYIIRRIFEQSNDNTYVASLSSRTIVYKGMFLVKQLRVFFEDLHNEDYESAIAIVHSRFSTNTNPSWHRAHPNRFIVHNGEINTIRDGEIMGAVLDRNGLRPSRYYITEDNKLILSSEVGVLDIPPEKIIKKERLRPGRMLLVDTIQGKLIDDEDLKERYASRSPYGEWLDSNLVELRKLHIPNKKITEYSSEELAKLHKAFGYTYEGYKNTILPMAQEGHEPISAMGSDIPLPILSHTYPPLFSYFRQLFAQVTNPPIDAIREEIVTSASVYLGKDGNILEEKAENCKVLKINNTILTNTDLLKIKAMKISGFKVETISITYYKNTSLERALDHIFLEADRAYKGGANILILSDRGVDENHVAIPSLLAVSAMQQHLVRTKKRTAVAMILESAEPIEVHHFASLLGYGACAVNPYLVGDTIKQLIADNILDKDYYAAVDDYNKAVIKGIVKIASKMGISTIQSYQGSKIFEAIGIDKGVIDKYFTDTVSRIGGITLKDIETQVDEMHTKAFVPLGL